MTPSDVSKNDSNLDNIPNTEQESQNLVAYLTDWNEDNLALLCGIANAGGGAVIVSPDITNQTKKMKRLRKPFETIPRLSQQELKISCTTEPIMDGSQLCLGIQVPKATTPIQYKGKYYLYSDNINTVVTKDLLDRLGIEDSSNSQTTDHKTYSSHSQKLNPRKTFVETSFAAANRLDLTSTDEYILKVLETNGRATAPRISKVLGVSESTVRRSFRRLREYNLIERIGSNKAGYWRLID